MPPAPSRGLLPVDAPKRYRPGVPARPTSRTRLGGGSRGYPGCACGLCRACVLFGLGSLSPARCPFLGRVARALPAALFSPEPQSPGLRGRSFPARAAHSTGAAPDRDQTDCCPTQRCVCVCVCVSVCDPRLRAHSWASREESGPGGWDSRKLWVLVWKAGEGERVLSSRSREGGEHRVVCVQPQV